MLTRDPRPALLHQHLIPRSISAQSDCDCDCSQALNNHDLFTPIAAPRAESDYIQTPDLYRAPLDEHHELCFNPRSGAGVLVLNRQAAHVLDIFRVPQKLFNDWPSVDREDADRARQLVEQFVSLGLLSVPGQPPVFQRSNPETLAVWMHVTNQCNLRCSYCYLHKSAEQMSLETGQRAIDTIFSTAQRYRFRAVKIKFSGGEATLCMPLVFQLHAYAEDRANSANVSLQSVILSNGIAISRRTAQQLGQKGIRVMISLDGVGAHHDAQRVFANGRGSFALVDRAIDTLLMVGLIPNISVTISDRNLDGLPSLIDYILDRDLPFNLSLYRENDCSAALADLVWGERRLIEAMLGILRQIEQRLPVRSLVGSLTDKAHFIAPHDQTCAVGSNYMVIDQHGNISKCQMEIERPITTIFADDPLRAIRSDTIGVQNIAVDEKEGCRDCNWRYWCTGGCPIRTYRATGRYDIKSPNCNIYKALFPAVLRLEGLRILKYSHH